MASNLESPEIETESNPEHGDLGVQILNPEQLAQENQVLKDKVGAMEAQVHEMMVMLQSLKSETAAEGVAVVGPVGVTSFIPPPIQTVPFSAPVPSQQGSDSQKAQGYQYKRRTSFDSIPMTCTELFNHLTSKNLINTRPMKALQPPFPRSYNANATCSFHENGVGHTVEECRAFKHAVQDLVDAGRISFKQNSSNTTTHPLPGHEKSATNAIESPVGRLIRSAEKVKTPLEVIHAELCKFGVIKRGCTQKGVCVDDNCAGACKAFKTVLQDLLDRHTTQIGVQEYKDGHGLGYRPTQADKKRMAEEKREKRSAKLQRREPNLKEVPIYDPSLSIPVCDIRQSFVSAGLLDHNQIAVIGNGSGAEEGETGLVRRCLAGEKLKNGEVAAFPVVFNST